MDIRLMGTRAEISEVVDAVRAVLDVQEVSQFYPNRGASERGRVYLAIGGVRTNPIRAKAERVEDPPQVTGRGQLEERRAGEAR